MNAGPAVDHCARLIGDVLSSQVTTFVPPGGTRTTAGSVPVRTAGASRSGADARTNQRPRRMPVAAWLTGAPLSSAAIDSTAAEMRAALSPDIIDLLSFRHRRRLPARCRSTPEPFLPNAHAPAGCPAAACRHLQMYGTSSLSFRPAQS